MHMTEVETHKARKAHRCEWCWQRIDEGTEYKRYRYYADGEAATIKMHPECMEAMQEEAAHWGGYFEWTPGQERPKVDCGNTEPDRHELPRCFRCGHLLHFGECVNVAPANAELRGRPLADGPA